LADEETRLIGKDAREGIGTKSAGSLLENAI
jgi:hypothetical protein